MKNNWNNYLILIPAYNPSQKLIDLINDFSKYQAHILIINDGSKSKKIFSKIKNYPNLILLGYEINHGKGYAIKYGIKYYLDNLIQKYKGIITVDADYQHIPSDVSKIVNNMNESEILLGTRNFNLKTVPFTNRMGNKITSLIFKLLYTKKIIDTQTGLRGIPNKYLIDCLNIKGDRFEYEMQQLIYFVNNKIDIMEIEIETVYYSENESKFDKIIDSIKIYKVMLNESIKFIITSLIAALFDVIGFTIFLNIFINLNDFAVIIASFLARIISEFINFCLTKHFVFKSKDTIKSIIFKYYLLSFTKILVSAMLVLLISKILLINKTLIKVIVDTFIYLISYRIQKKYIFNFDKENKKIYNE